MDKLTPVLWILLVIPVIIGLWVNRPRKISVDAPLPESFPDQGFSHEIFAGLLQTYVSEDGQSASHHGTMKKDFVNHMVALGRPAKRGLLDYLESVASDPLLEDLKKANDYTIEYRDYDWSLNEAD